MGRPFCHLLVAMDLFGILMSAQFLPLPLSSVSSAFCLLNLALSSVGLIAPGGRCCPHPGPCTLEMAVTKAPEPLALSYLTLGPRYDL